MGLDEYFSWFQLPEGRQIQFAQMKLAGQARIYWRNLQTTVERRRETAVATWAEMKGWLREKYVPACYRPMIIDEWQHLQQGDGTVVEYIARFDKLMIRCNIEKAYRYTTNMELYSSHAQRAGYTWFSSSEMTRTRHATLDTAIPPSLFPTSPSATVLPPLLRPPLRLLLPPATPETSLPSATMGYGNRAGNAMNPQPI